MYYTRVIDSQSGGMKTNNKIKYYRISIYQFLAL